MIYYLLFFSVCFLVEYLKKRKSKSYKVLVLLLFIFLCFGYMTGSDWRGYEISYNEKSFWRFESTGEIGYIFVAKFFSFFIHDFWVYCGLMKGLYLAALISFFKCFTNKPYIAVALGFANSLLFMLIDCPMRFMMAITLVLWAFILLFSNRGKRNTIISSFLLLLSVTLHTAMLIMISFVLLAFFASRFCKYSTAFVLSFYCGAIILASLPGVFDFIFNVLIPMVGEDRFENYTRKELNSLMTINTIRYTILFLVLLANKSLILSRKNGEYIYFYACMYFLFFPITYSIPTMFRLNILFGLFADISFAYILYERKRNLSRKQIESAIILSMTLFLLCWNCAKEYKLTPYSNSIPYIMTGEHLPYTYRDSYNPNHHDAEFWF